MDNMKARKLLLDVTTFARHYHFLVTHASFYARALEHSIIDYEGTFVKRVACIEGA